MKKIRFIWSLFLFTLIFLRCSEEKAAKLNSQKHELDPVSFEKWVIDTLSSNKQNELVAITTCEAVILRLANHRIVTHKTIMQSVIGIRIVEREIPLDSTGKKKEFRFTRSVDYIKSILSFTYDDKLLESELYRHLAYLYRIDDLWEQEIECHEKALKILNELYPAMNEWRLETELEMAGSMFVLGKKKQAEEAYRRVLSFDWTSIPHSEMRTRLMTNYIAAGRGLIECHRGDAYALKILYFRTVPGDELQLELNKALKEVEK